MDVPDVLMTGLDRQSEEDNAEVLEQLKKKKHLGGTALANEKRYLHKPTKQWQ